jgi:hypothetical protein
MKNLGNGRFTGLIATHVVPECRNIQIMIGIIQELNGDF